jgi:hypothetical protein
MNIFVQIYNHGIPFKCKAIEHIQEGFQNDAGRARKVFNGILKLSEKD